MYSILVPPEDCSPEDRDQFFDELQSKFNDMRSTLHDCVRFGSDNGTRTCGNVIHS